MRVVVLGATGNVGTSVLASLVAESAVSEVLAVARRPASFDSAKVEFAEADITSTDLAPLLRGADAVVHLAWLIQPGRDEALTSAVNVEGSERVFRAVADAGVRALVYASSVGAYSAGPKDRLVAEDWPTGGIRTSFYSRHKAAVERLLDRFEAEAPGVRVVRLRPGLIFKAEAATEIRRLFIGPLLPHGVARRELVPVVPDVGRLRFQAVHSLDVGEAYRLAVLSDLGGAFNIAADPVLDPAELGRLLGARRLPMPGAVLRGAAALSYKLRLQPTEPGWVDMALGVPLMDTTRARRELGWQPRHTGSEALMDLLDGLRDGADFDTPPLARATSGPLRSHEFATGLGARP